MTVTEAKDEYELARTRALRAKEARDDADEEVALSERLVNQARLHLRMAMQEETHAGMAQAVD